VRKDVKSIGDILSGLGDLLHGLSSLAEQGTEVLRSAGGHTARTPTITYGWSIGPVSRSAAPDGAAAPSAARPQGAAAVQDVFDEGAFVRAVLDVPGVVNGDIRFHVDGQTLTVEARRHGGRRVIRLPLPAAVVADGATSSYRNGVFEILLPKASHGSR